VSPVTRTAWNAVKIHGEERVPGRSGRATRGGPQETECPVSLPLDDLPFQDLPRRVALLLLLLAREAELAVEQVDGPRAHALVRRGLTGGARVSLPCSPGRRSPGSRPWMCQIRRGG
jgi:hypothetical protein